MRRGRKKEGWCANGKKNGLEILNHWDLDSKKPGSESIKHGINAQNGGADEANNKNTS